jgi:formylglycine-generating enzyme required for sulfatase activity
MSKNLFVFSANCRGLNYLIPVKSNIKEETEVSYFAVNAGFVLAKMEAADNPLNIVILDACRNNPFKRSFRSSSFGLARMDAPDGTIIAYATKAGSVAEDGRGTRNSPYTSALLSNISTPGLDIRDMFNTVGLEVKKKTNGDQIPWTSNDPFPDYYLAGGVPTVVSPSDRPPTKIQDKIQGQVWTEPITGMEFVWIPPGCFQMESNSSEAYSKEKPVHKVCLDGFWMANHEVTNKQYRKYKPNHDSQDYKGVNLNKDDQPAVYVSWDDAKDFAQWLSRQNGQKFVLPTEAQWEYAARAGTKTERFWGDNPDDACKYANVHDQTSKKEFNWSREEHKCNDGYAGTAPVGSFQANSFDLYDTLGNVWEWCEDVYDEKAYEKHEPNNPLITTGSTYRVIRGGGWDSYPRFVHAAYRNRITAVNRNFILGFRLCLSQVQQ